MSIGPTGISAGAAGSPLAQTSGSEVERAQEELNARRRIYHLRKAEAAAGVSETDGEEHQSAERDADGRQSCEAPAAAKGNVASSAPRQSKDHRQQRGNLLDLTG